MIYAKSSAAKKALSVAQNLQKYFVTQLNSISQKYGKSKDFEAVEWLRDAGAHGGGVRFEARDESLFNAASVNVSQVHYDDIPSKNLNSASAISTIIHPKNPNIPSIHMHISFTELREGKSYWRIMADLNPSVRNDNDARDFDAALQMYAKDKYEEAKQQGDKYFYIPALKRHRGIVHFYLENYFTENEENDIAYAKAFGIGVINAYTQIFENALQRNDEIMLQQIEAQLRYHTVYLFQVLTLDRGTTSGLLIHDQNDVGIMGSLPSRIDRGLLESFSKLVDEPQNYLVEKIVDAIQDDGVVDVKVKQRLANVVREHYRQYPESLKFQASGNSIPSTVGNHK